MSPSSCDGAFISIGPIKEVHFQDRAFWGGGGGAEKNNLVKLELRASLLQYSHLRYHIDILPRIVSKRGSKARRVFLGREEIGEIRSGLSCLLTRVIIKVVVLLSVPNNLEYLSAANN